MSINSVKLRFALIGAGWRAMYYVRVAKALPDHFECVGILCRTAEKAAAVEQNCGIPTVTSAEAIRNLNPDVVYPVLMKTIDNIVFPKDKKGISPERLLFQVRVQ